MLYLGFLLKLSDGQVIYIQTFTAADKHFKQFQFREKVRIAPKVLLPGGGFGTG